MDIPTFTVIDKETGREVSAEVIQQIAKNGGYSFVPNMDKYGYPFNPMEMYNESEKARFNVRAVWKG